MLPPAPHMNTGGLAKIYSYGTPIFVDQTGRLNWGGVCLKGDGVMAARWGQVGGVPTEGDGGLCFREAYPNCTVLEARPCYNVARLMFLDAER